MSGMSLRNSWARLPRIPLEASLLSSSLERSCSGVLKLGENDFFILFNITVAKMKVNRCFLLIALGGYVIITCYRKPIRRVNFCAKIRHRCQPNLSFANTLTTDWD